MEGTYYDPKTKRLGLQIRDPAKNYDAYPIIAAAEANDADGIAAAWAEAESAPEKHKNNRGQNVFHVLCRFGHLAALKALFELRNLEERAMARSCFDRAVRELDGNKQRCLHLAASHPAVLDVLLTRVYGRRGGGSINGVDFKLRTPLHRASLVGCKESVLMLLEAGAEVCAPSHPCPPHPQPPPPPTPRLSRQLPPRCTQVLCHGTSCGPCPPLSFSLSL